MRRLCCGVAVLVAIIVARADGGVTLASASQVMTPAAVSMPPRTGHAMADAGPDVGVVAIGGAVTAETTAWRFNGTTWQPLATGGPANRMMIAAAYDTRRHVLVAFGGVGTRNGSRYGETWEWKGRTWQERDVRGPGARDHHALAYDEARGQVVMYGGMDGDHKSLQSDTWTWDGVTWTRAEERSGPGGLAHHAMAYDTRRQRVVLYGGITDSGPATDDVWEWDGRTWLRISAPGPGVRSHLKMAYDTTRQRIVMTGGNRSTRPYDVLADTWEWDGAMWKESAASGQQTVTPAPPARAHHSTVYDAANKRVIVAGGSTSQDGGKTYSTFDDLWSFDGTGWKSLGSSGVTRSGMALAFDSKRNRVLAFGGYCPCQPSSGGRYDDLLELRDGKWQPISRIPSRPSTDSKMIYDTRRDRLVLVGGSTPASRQATDVWEFDGTVWKQFEGPGPGALSDVAMTYDERRGRTVVFGAGETWEFDGATWSRVSTTGPVPPPTPSLVYDSRRGTAILHGHGTTTWSWNGREWTKLTDAAPPARYFGALAYDADRDRVVLFGGRPGLPKPDANDTWEWDGSSWKESRVAGLIR